MDSFFAQLLSEMKAGFGTAWLPSIIIYLLLRQELSVIKNDIQWLKKSIASPFVKHSDSKEKDLQS